MLFENVILSEKRGVELKLFIHDPSAEYHQGIRKPLIIVCPGGGYSYLSDREGEPIALRFLAAGFQAAVLKYGINEYAVAPGPLKDIAAAVAYIKNNAERYSVNPDEVFVCGFSAGGHVAAQLGVFWNNGELLPEYCSSPELIKPAGMILGYPVINLKASTKHLDIGIPYGTELQAIEFGQCHPKMPRERYFLPDRESGKIYADFELAMNAFIFDGEYTEEEENQYCLEQHVSKDTPPAFIWHAAGDGLIYPSNSLDFASALARENIDYELHIYNGGGHGLATASYVTEGEASQNYPPADGWLDLAVAWVNRMSGFKKEVEDHFDGNRSR